MQIDQKGDVGVAMEMVSMSSKKSQNDNDDAMNCDESELVLDDANTD